MCRSTNRPSTSSKFSPPGIVSKSSGVYSRCINSRFIAHLVCFGKDDFPPLYRFLRKPELRIAHRYGRLAAVLDPHPPVLRVARRRMLPILFAQLRELVGLDRLPLRLDIDAEQLGRVEAENLVLDVVG